MNTGSLEGIDPRIPGPRWTNTCESLFDDPIAFVEAAKREHGDLVAVTEGWSVFSRSQECTGCVAAFGARNNKQVLSDPTTFGTQVPLADRLALPEKLRILGSSLFNMSGEKHRQRRLPHSSTARPRAGTTPRSPRPAAIFSSRGLRKPSLIRYPKCAV